MPKNIIKPDQEIEVITWKDIANGACIIADWVQKNLGDNVSIYGIPRGGTIPAIMMVHQLEARGLRARFTVDLNHLMPAELHKLVVIDEICDSGDTFKVIKQLFPMAKTTISLGG
jgi:hypoxanthine phosphoribosyltransferase